MNNNLRFSNKLICAMCCVTFFRAVYVYLYDLGHKTCSPHIPIYEEALTGNISNTFLSNILVVPHVSVRANLVTAYVLL